MKESSVKFPLARFILRTAPVGFGIPPVIPAISLVLLLVTVGCVTTIPRPGESTGELPIPTPSPTATPTITESTPIPTRQPEPTATTAPTPAPTLEPGPIEPTPTATATTAPTPAPTDDHGGLMLQVYAPEEGATVPGASVVVYGQTFPGARVHISGVEAEVDAQGGFRADISLAPAENEVVIIAQDEAGRRRRVTRTVTSLALPFLLLVTEPENQSIVSVSFLSLSGRTGPNAIVSVNGRSVPVDRFGYFSSSVQLDEGPNVIDVVATNDDGRTLSTVLAVIYRAPRN